jgi:hypothetical protein
MRRLLTFTRDDDKKFDLLYTGFLLGGNTVNQSSRPPHERKKEAKIQRALKAVSEPMPPTDGQPADDNRRRLRTSDVGGIEVALEQDQHDLLLKYVEACPFLTHVSDQVDELLDWLHAAPRDEGS